MKTKKLSIEGYFHAARTINTWVIAGNEYIGLYQLEDADGEQENRNVENERVTDAVVRRKIVLL